MINQIPETLPIERFTELEKTQLELAAVKRSMIIANRTVLQYMEQENDLFEKAIVEQIRARLKAEDAAK